MSATQTPVQPEIGALTPRTRRLLDRVDAMAQLPPEQASVEVAALQSDIAVLLGATSNFKNQAEAERELCKRKLGELEPKLAEMRDHDAALRRDADALQARIAQCDRTSAELESQQGQLARDLDDLNRRMGERARKLEELKSWWWVPGYGQYLAIRTLVDNDIGEVKSLQDNLGHVARGLGDTHARRAAVLANLETVRVELSRVANTRSSLEHSLGLLRAEHLRVRHNWDFAVQAFGFWSELSAIASAAGERSANIAVFLEYMAKTTAAPAPEGGVMTFRPLRDALLDFARLYDEAYDTVLNPMTTIASYPLLSGAQLEDVVGGNGPLYASGALLMTPELRELDVRRFTISVEFDPAGFPPNVPILVVGDGACTVALDEARRPQLNHPFNKGRKVETASRELALGQRYEAKLRYDGPSHTLALFINDERVCTVETVLGVVTRQCRIGVGIVAGSYGNLKIKSSPLPSPQ